MQDVRGRVPQDQCASGAVSRSERSEGRQYTEVRGQRAVSRLGQTRNATVGLSKLCVESGSDEAAKVWSCCGVVGGGVGACQHKLSYGGRSSASLSGAPGNTEQEEQHKQNNKTWSVCTRETRREYGSTPGEPIEPENRDPSESTTISFRFLQTRSC